MNELNWQEKDVICKTKGLHIKFTEQIRDYPDFYETKINKLQGMLYEERGKYDELLRNVKGRLTVKDIDELSDILQLSRKIDRLRAKQKAVLYELEGRKLGTFKHVPHGTIYYIDLDAGNDGNTGLHWTTPWLTVQQYASVTVRTAGDIAYIRAGTQQVLGAVVEFDEDGDKDQYIYIIGCDATVDPWGDGSNVKPIYNANGGAFYIYLNGDNYWYLDNLDLRGNAGGANCGLYINASYNNVLDNLDIHGNGTRGVLNRYGSNPYFYKCEFWNNPTASFYSIYTGNKITFDSCIFNSGAGGSNYGILCDYGGGRFEIINSSFGQTTAHGVYDIYTGNATSIFYLKNTEYNSIVVGALSFGGHYFSEDNQVYKDALIITHPGTITKDTAVKTGNAEFSLRFEPNAQCGLNNPLKAEAFDSVASSYVVEGVAGVETTVTIKIRSYGAWATYPTADELYIEASYYSNGATCDRSTVRSTMVLDDETTWRSFSVTMTPARSGNIYINVYLKKYEGVNIGCSVNGEVDVGI